MHFYQQQDTPLSHQAGGFEYNEVAGSVEQPGYHYRPSASQYEPARFAPPQPQVSPLADVTLPAALSYSLGWFTGIIFCLFGWQNRYIRFHALQAVIFFGMINIIDVGLLRFMFVSAHRMHGHMTLLIAPVVFAFLLLNCIAFVGWVMGMIQAARGRYYRLPFIGGLVARIVRVGETVK